MTCWCIASNGWSLECGSSIHSPLVGEEIEVNDLPDLWEGCLFIQLPLLSSWGLQIPVYQQPTISSDVLVLQRHNCPRLCHASVPRQKVAPMGLPPEFPIFKITGLYRLLFLAWKQLLHIYSCMLWLKISIMQWILGPLISQISSWPSTTAS